MRKYGRPIIIHLFIPLIAGFLVYLVFRRETWLHHILSVSGDKNPFIIPDKAITRIIAFNLPDFCWCYAFVSAMFIWERWQGQPVKWFSLFVFVVLLAGEFIQLLSGHLFTFDLLDIFAAILAFFMSYCQTKKNEKI